MTVEFLVPPIRMQVVDSEAKECVAFRGYKPPPVILLDSEESSGLKALACPSSESVPAAGSSRALSAHTLDEWIERESRQGVADELAPVQRARNSSK